MSNSYYGNSSRSSARAAARALAAPQREEKWRRGVTYLLPAVLIVLTALVTGSFFETNDDMTMVMMLRGSFAQQPVADLHLAFHGVSHLLAFAYSVLPDVPWYGLFLLGSYYLAVVMMAGLLHKLGRRLFTNEQLAMLVVFLFLGALADSVFSFNYTRIALTLAGCAFLTYAFDAKDPTRRHTRALILCALALLLAMCISTGAAILGVLLALPGALRVPGRSGVDFRNLVTSLVPFALVGVMFYSLNVLTRSDDEITYDRNRQKQEFYEDFGLYYFHQIDRSQDPRTYAIKEAVREEVLGDRQAVNVPFFDRAGGYDWKKFMGGRAPGKLKEVVQRLGKDYFLVLVVNLILVIYCYQRLKSRTRRRLLLFMQLWILVLLLGMAVLFKLPPRLAAPSLAIMTLVNATFFLRHRRFRKPSAPVWLWGLVLLLLAGHIYRAGMRLQQLTEHQRRSEGFLTALKLRFQGQFLLTAGLEEYLAYLSPWETYSLGNNRVLPLTGWQTLAPEYKDWLKHETRETSFDKAILAATTNPKAIWVVPIGFEDRLNHLLGTVHNKSIRLVPFEPFVPAPTGDETIQYMVAIPEGHAAPLGPIPGTLRATPVAAPVAPPAPAADTTRQPPATDNR